MPNLLMICSRLFILLTLASACTKKTTVVQSKELFLKGDPMTFVSNTKMDASQGIPASLFKDQENWLLFDVVFVEEPQEEIKSREELLERNKPQEKPDPENVEKALRSYSFKLPKATEAQEFAADSNRINDFQFQLQQSGSKIIFQGLTHTYKGFKGYTNYKTLHYSVKEDKTAFSVLMSFKQGPARVLANMTFRKIEKDRSVLTQLIDDAYNYLLGPGVKISWNQSKPLNVMICDPGTAGVAQLIEKSINRWAPHLENRLFIQPKIVSQCPPFSDLNTHTVSHIKEWVMLFGPDALRYAEALIIPDIYKSEFIDGDIFLLEKEWDDAFKGRRKLSDPNLYTLSRFRKLYSSVMVHEFGHILGLAHVFDGRKSIMSYEDETAIQKYDIEAVQALYPEL